LGRTAKKMALNNFKNYEEGFLGENYLWWPWSDTYINKSCSFYGDALEYRKALEKGKDLKHLKEKVDKIQKELSQKSKDLIEHYDKMMVKST
jgi:hypothetical protein